MVRTYETAADRTVKVIDKLGQGEKRLRAESLAAGG